MKSFISIFIIIMITSFFPAYASEYKPWSENVFTYIKDKYGQDAEKRMRYLHKLIIENQNKTDQEKLILVNNTFNQFPWISDKSKWQQADYWASPLEVITTFGGDCEDITFAKWTMLRHLGIDKDQLYFAYVVQKQSKQAHMVLLYKETPNVALDESKVYILDNMDPDVKLAKDRMDLKGVYAFKPSGEIYLIHDDGKKRSISGYLSSRHFKSLGELRRKFHQDREDLKKINNNEYLLPEL